MRFWRISGAISGAVLFVAGVLTAAGQASNLVTSAPVYVPDYSKAGEILPGGLIAWDTTQKTLDATNGQEIAQFVFDLTNTSPGAIAILAARGSCSCTTVQLPPTPWLIPAGGTGKIGVAINLTGKIGTLFHQAIITTDKGMQNLMLRVNIPSPSAPPMSDAARAQGIAAAKLDRQAVFKGDCVNCHAKNIADRYGPDLFGMVCAVCHEASPRSTMVPDLHNLKDATSEEFWSAWITSGKPGTLMPAFATAQGGPLTDLQIASLAAYLNTAIPSHAAPAPK